MKKIFLSLLISLIAFSVFSQEPNHNKKPKLFQPGNWYMVGQWDSVSGSYKDTIGYYLESDTIYHWSNKYFRHNGSFSATSFINTNNSFNIDGINLIRYNKDSINLSIGYLAGDSATRAAITSIGYAAGYQSTGSVGNFIGFQAGNGNKGNYVDAIGTYSMVGNMGDTVLGLGLFSGQYPNGTANSLDNWIYIGLHKGDTNTTWINGYSPSNGTKRIRLNGDVYLKNKLSFPIFSATIADTLTPTEAELTTAIGLTPAQAGSGGSFVVKSTSGCLYDIISDGTNYYCTKRKKLW